MLLSVTKKFVVCSCLKLVFDSDVLYLLLQLWVIMLSMECFIFIVLAWDFKIKQQNKISLSSKGFVLLKNTCVFHVWPFQRSVDGLRKKRQIIFGLTIWIWIPPIKNRCWPIPIGTSPVCTSTLAIDCLVIVFRKERWPNNEGTSHWESTIGGILPSQ